LAYARREWNITADKEKEAPNAMIPSIYGISVTLIE
jgi:hypothetical protein